MRKRQRRRQTSQQLSPVTVQLVPLAAKIQQQQQAPRAGGSWWSQSDAAAATNDNNNKQKDENGNHYYYMTDDAVAQHQKAQWEYDEYVRRHEPHAKLLGLVGLWHYVTCLQVGLLSFGVFLLLPKSVKRLYCRSDRRRYARRKKQFGHPQPKKLQQREAQGWRTAVFDDMMMNHNKDDATTTLQQTLSYKDHDPEQALSVTSSSWEDTVEVSLATPEEKAHRMTMRPMGIADNDAAMFAHQTPSPQKRSRLPSPHHPQIRHTPDEAVWREALARLGSLQLPDDADDGFGAAATGGVRLTAHGVQCQAKRLYLGYRADEASLYWQTELPERRGGGAIVLVRGPAHALPLANVVYVDVGKKTLALQKSTALIPASTCFSLLTQQGSLDLQAASKHERDAVVCALSYLLDHVHAADVDWRRLYHDEGDGSSLVSSDTTSMLSPPDPTSVVSSVTNPTVSLRDVSSSSLSTQLFPGGSNAEI